MCNAMLQISETSFVKSDAKHSWSAAIIVRGPAQHVIKVGCTEDATTLANGLWYVHICVESHAQGSVPHAKLNATTHAYTANAPSDVVKNVPPAWRNVPGNAHISNVQCYATKCVIENHVTNLVSVK